MPILEIQKVKFHEPQSEAQKNYYMTKLLDEMNLTSGKISAYETNIGNHKNEIDKAQTVIGKLRNRLVIVKAEYKKTVALDFTVKVEEAPEAEPEPESEPVVQEEQSDAEELLGTMAQKLGIPIETLKDKLKK